VKDGSTSRLVPLTSSTIPTVRSDRGSLFASSSKTADAIAGVNSLDASP
jgi:hypothetical protein